MRLPDVPLLRAALAFMVIIGALTALALLLRPLLVHILLSFVLYALLSPAVTRLTRAGFSQPWAIATVLFGVTALLAGTLTVAVPALTYQLVVFQERLPAMWTEVVLLADWAERWLSVHAGVEVKAAALTAPLIEPLRAGGMEAVTRITSTLANVASILLLVPLLTFFLLRDLRSIRNGLMDLLPNHSFELGWLIYGKVVEKLDNYVRGVMIQSGIIAAITTFGFAFIGLEMAGLLGLLAGLLNVIPYVGPLLAMVPPSLLILAANGPDMWLQVGHAVAVILTAQLFDNLVVVPTLIAQAADLHPLTVLGGIVVMGYFFGFFGMILAIPVLFSSKLVFLGLLHGLRGERPVAA